MSKKPTPQIGYAALSVDLSGKEAPAEFRLLPAGKFRSHDGRPTDCAEWVMSDEDGRRLVAEANARRSDYVIDYEHSTLHAKEKGEKAIASGWYKNLEWRPGDGLYTTDAKWTAAASAHIAADEYRYLSPLFTYDKKTGRVLKLICAALTNDPGFDGLTDLAALSATEFFNQEESMNELLKKLLAALGLSETASEEETLAAVEALKSAKKAVEGQAAASAAIPDPAKYVTMEALAALSADNQKLQADYAALSAQIETDKRDKLIAVGMADGKITPALEPWAREQSIAALSSFIEKAVATVTPGTTQTDGKNAPNEKPEDSNTIAMAALSYQAEQAAKGISVSTVQAVAHVQQKGK